MQIYTFKGDLPLVKLLSHADFLTNLRDCFGINFMSQIKKNAGLRITYNANF